MKRITTRHVITAVAACAAALALTIPAFSHGPGPHGKKAVLIGKVESFANGILVVKTKNGSSVSGAYSSRSKTFCFTAKKTGTTPTTTQTTPTTTIQTTPTATVSKSDGKHGKSGSDRGGFENSSKLRKRGRCKSSNLTAGVDVIGGKLNLSADGLKWESVSILLPRS